jgi:membrane dipeptidase
MLGVLALGALLAADPAAPARRPIVIDTHADTTQAIVYGGVDVTRPQPELALDLTKAAAGGLGAQFFSIFVAPFQFKPPEFYKEAIHQLDALERLARANPKRLRLARTAADVRKNPGGPRPPAAGFAT